MSPIYVLFSKYFSLFNAEPLSACNFDPPPRHTTITLRNHVHQHRCIMWFCPLDGTLLQIITTSNSNSSSSSMFNNESSTQLFACTTCPYSQQIHTSQIQKSYPINRKKVDDILGGANAWVNVDRTSAVCPSCSCGEAYFMQMQIRSADEPMSVFYKCVQCSHQWNDK